MTKTIEAKFELENLTGAILSNYIALHYNEKLKYTRFYKQELKRKLNISNKELIFHEEKEFDLVLAADENTTHNVSGKLIDFMDLIIRDGFDSHLILSNVITAFNQDPKRLEGVVNKILKDEKKR
jgi:predicted nicotinamide N-methyase